MPLATPQVSTAHPLRRGALLLAGAVARQTQATDLGGFLDITLDFVF
jgi:hypothetical protein